MSEAPERIWLAEGPRSYWQRIPSEIASEHSGDVKYVRESDWEITPREAQEIIQKQAERIEELERERALVRSQIAALDVPFPEQHTGIPFAELTDNDKWQVAVGAALLAVSVRLTRSSSGDPE